MSEYTHDHNAQKWRSQRVVMARGVNFMLRKGSLEPAQTLPESPEKYDRFARQLREKFNDAMLEIDTSAKDDDEASRRKYIAHWAQGSRSIGAGFDVLCRLLGYGADAYRQFCEKEGQQPDLNELQSALCNPKTKEHLISWFADTSNSSNRSREDVFGLRANDFSYNLRHNFNPFVLNVDLQSGLMTIGHNERSYLDATVGDYKGKTAEFERCPAHDVLLRLWDQLVTIACDDPTIFAKDLGLAVSAQES